MNFKVSRYDFWLIDRLTDRAMMMNKIHGTERKRIDVQMDVIACHANGCPLRLQELLGADDVNFAHDIFGIQRHLDRTTGRLTDNFTPRYKQEED